MFKENWQPILRVLFPEPVEKVNPVEPQYLHKLFKIGSPRYLIKWLPISMLIGIIAGLGAIAFYLTIHFTTNTFLGQLVGYLPPEPGGEGGRSAMPFWSAVRPWLLPVITTTGGLLSGILVYVVAPEAEGHGTDTAIHDIHESKTIRFRVPLIKMIASAIIIGTGGSAGREGPAAQISAGFGSMLATLFKLEKRDRRIAMAAGLGAGIGAIFRTPLGGALLAAEILYLNDWEIEAIFPALIASVTSYGIFGFWDNWQPLFPPMHEFTISTPLQLLYYVPLGVICGLVGLFYARSFYGSIGIFAQIKLAKWLKPALGGLCVGLLGLALPQILGGGDGWLQLSMGKSLLTLPLWLLLLLPFAKIAATSLTVGSGGSGGIFGPGIVIGGLIGAAVWRLCYPALPGIPDTPGPFVIVGMVALFGGIAHVPIAVMLMVVEMTGNLSILVPAMIAVTISSLLIGNVTIYRSQYISRKDAPAHRLEFSFPRLAEIPVKDIVTEGLRFSTTQKLSYVETVLLRQELFAGLVVDREKSFIGMILLSDIEHIPGEDRGHRTVKQALKQDIIVIDAATPLDKAMILLTSHNLEFAPVVTKESNSTRVKAVGVITTKSIQQAYEKQLHDKLAVASAK